MNLKIAVCVKSVPNPDQFSSLSLGPVSKTLIREGIDSVINPADLHAIELAVQLKERYGAHISLISMGPQQAQKELRMGLAYGPDDAFLVSDREFGGADSLATSYVLAKALEKAGPFDLIILGNESADGATAHVPSQVGIIMGLPNMTDIVGFSLDENGKARVKKRLQGRYAIYEAELPLVIGVAKDINKVRTAGMRGVLGAKNKPLTVWSVENFEDLDKTRIGLSGSPTQGGEYHTASFGREATELKGSPEEIASELSNIIRPILGRE